MYRLLNASGDMVAKLSNRVVQQMIAEVWGFFRPYTTETGKEGAAYEISSYVVYTSSSDMVLYLHAGSVLVPEDLFYNISYNTSQLNTPTE